MREALQDRDDVLGRRHGCDLGAQPRGRCPLGTVSEHGGYGFPDGSGRAVLVVEGTAGSGGHDGLAVGELVRPLRSQHQWHAGRQRSEHGAGPAMYDGGGGALPHGRLVDAPLHVYGVRQVTEGVDVAVRLVVS